MPSPHSHHSRGVIQSLSVLLVLLSLLFSSAAAALPLQGAPTSAPAAASPTAPGGPTSLTNQATLSGSPANLLSAPLLKAVTSVVRKDFYLPGINK